MRIIVTTNFSPWSPFSGGGQRSTHNLAVALSRRGHRVTVIYTRSPLERPDVPRALPYELRWATFLGFRSRRQAPLRFANAITVARAVAAELERGGVDAVHGNGEEAALVPLLEKRRAVRFVVTPRYPRYPEALSRGRRLGLRDRLVLAATDPKYLALGVAVRGADACCPTSESAASMICRAYSVDARKVHVIPNGVTEVFFERRWLAPPRPESLVVFFGQLHASKGPDVLIDALGILGIDGPRCLVVGRGEMEGSLRRRVAELGLEGRVRFEPWKAPEDLAEILSGSSLAVLPSRRESFGNAIAEAMAVGVPVISTRVGSVPEIVDHGRTGWLVPSDDSRALAEAIRMLLASPEAARALAEAGRLHVTRSFSWDAVAAAYEALYRGAGAAS